MQPPERDRHHGNLARLGDYYSLTLPNQWIVVTDVPAGTYTLRSTVNPGNEFTEAHYDDNVLEETRVIPGATATDVATDTAPGDAVNVELSGTVEGANIDVIFETGASYRSASSRLDFELVDRPENGSLGSLDRTGNATTEVRYSPDSGFVGTDTFTYRTTDDRDLESQLATVTVTVGGSSPEPAPAPPPAPPPAEAPPPSAAATPAATPSARLVRQELLGTSLADLFEGTTRHELFRGLSGPDEIEGMGGNDLAYGGRGRDSMKLGNGRDIGHGGKGKDTIKLGNGADYGYGGRGSDLLVGGNGRDTLYGGRGGDTLKIRDGKPDVADCGLGLDTVIADVIDVIDESCEIVELPPETEPADESPEQQSSVEDAGA